MATVCARCEAATATVACSQCASHDDAVTVVYCFSCSVHAHQELPTHDVTPWAVGLKHDMRKKLEQYKREVDVREFLCLELERLAKDLKNRAKLRERVIRVTTVDMQTMLKQVAMSLIKQMETSSTEIVSNLSMQYNASMQDVLSAKQMIKDLEGYTSLDNEGFLQSGFKEVDMRLLQINTNSISSVVPSLVTSVEAFDKTEVDFSTVAASIKDVTFTTNSSKCDYQSMAIPAPKVESDLIMDVQISSSISRNGVFYVTPICSAEVSSKLRTLSHVIRLEVLRNSGWVTFGQSGIEPSVGSSVYVRYPADKNWYRGVVEEVKSLNYGVRLLDFGNLITVQADSMLPAKEDLFADCAAQAIGCCLFPHLDAENFPLDAKWYFSDNTKDVTVKCKFLDCLKSSTGQNIWFCNVLTQSKHGPELINLNDEINKKIESAQSTGSDSIRCRDIRYKYEESLQATYVETTTTTGGANMSETESVTSVAVSDEKPAGVSDEADKSQSGDAVDEISSMSTCPADVPDRLNSDIVASVNSGGVASKESTTDINKSTGILSNAVSSASVVARGEVDVALVDQSPFSNRSGHQYHGDATSGVVNVRPSDALSAAQIIGGPAPYADVNGHALVSFRPQYHGNIRSELVPHHLNDNARFPLPVLSQPMPVQQYIGGSQLGTSATGQGPQSGHAEGFRHPPPTLIQHQSSNVMRAITGLSTSQYDDNLQHSVAVAADRGQPQPRQWTEGTINMSSLSHMQPSSSIGSMTTSSLISSPASSLTLRHDAEPFQPSSPSTTEATSFAQPWPASANENYYMQSQFIVKNSMEAASNLGDITRGGVMPSSVNLSNVNSRSLVNSTIGDIQSLQLSVQQILTNSDSSMLPVYQAQTVASQLSSMLDAAVIQQQQQLCQAPARYPADTAWPPYASGPPLNAMLPPQPAPTELLRSLDLSKPPPPVLLAPSLRDSRSSSSSPGSAPLTAKALAATQNSMFCAMPSSRPATGYMPTVPYDYDRSDLLNPMASLPYQDAAAAAAATAAEVNLRDILGNYEKSQLSSSLALAPNSNTTARQLTETSNSQWQRSPNPSDLLAYLSTPQCSQFLAPVAGDTSLSDAAISTTTCADNMRGVSLSAVSEVVPQTSSQLPEFASGSSVVTAIKTSRSGVEQLTCDVGSAPLSSVYIVDSPCNENSAYMPPSPEHMLAAAGGLNQRSVLGLDVRASGMSDEAAGAVDSMVSNSPMFGGHALSGSAVDNVGNVTASHDLTPTANSGELHPQSGGGSKVPARVYDDIRCNVGSIVDALNVRLERESYFRGRVVTPLNVRGAFTMTLEHETQTAIVAWNKLNQLLQACRQQFPPTEIHCGQLLLVSNAQGVCLRARVVEHVDVDQVRVYCIDYGREQTVPRGLCWTLPEELHRVQPQAVWCSIGTNDFVFFDDEQQQLFSGLTNGVRLSAHVFFIYGDVYHVRLEDSSGQDLNQLIYHCRELQPNRQLDLDIADDKRSVASDDRAEHNERQDARVCYYCHKTGHMRNACPIRPPLPTVTCYECHQVGHTKRDCPNVRSGSTTMSNSTITCFSCGELGHSKRVCPKTTANDREQDKDSRGQYFNSKRQQRHHGQGKQRKAKTTSSAGDVDKYSSGGGHDGIH